MAPLAGAVFQLYDQNGCVVATAVSDTTDPFNVDFGPVSPGTYRMMEICSPNGFIGGGPYDVVVTTDGTVYIDGVLAEDFVATNTPYPNFTVRKVDDTPEENPLEGAIFQFRNNATNAYVTATSGIDGSVNFYGVAPGEYTLVEIKAPNGYVMSPEDYSVIVHDDGLIEFNGEFNPDLFVVPNTEAPDVTFLKEGAFDQSETPDITNILPGSTVVSGQGVTGSTIVVTWPDDLGTSTVIVDGSGEWMATAPRALILGEVVEAVQLTPNMLPSETATETVIDID